MPPVSRATVDTAGGLINNSRGIRVTIDGAPVAVQGDSVSAHPPCPRVRIHCSAATTASSGVTIDGIEITVAGDAATCGHSASASVAVTID